MHNLVQSLYLRAVETIGAQKTRTATPAVRATPASGRWAANRGSQRRTAGCTPRSAAASRRTSSDEADKTSVGSTVVSKDRISGAACGSAQVGMNRHDGNVVLRFAARRVIRPA